MGWGLVGVSLTLLASTTRALRYTPSQVGYNLNENQTATNPLDYWGEWKGHTYTPSPDQWRFPFYTLFLDRYVNGDPTNDNINGSLFEHDLDSTQMRHGGDVQGLIDSLDYLQGMGIKVGIISLSIGFGVLTIFTSYRDSTLQALHLSINHGARINTRHLI